MNHTDNGFLRQEETGIQQKIMTKSNANDTSEGMDEWTQASDDHVGNYVMKTGTK